MVRTMRVEIKSKDKENQWKMAKRALPHPLLVVTHHALGDAPVRLGRVRMLRRLWMLELGGEASMGRDLGGRAGRRVTPDPGLLAARLLLQDRTMPLARSKHFYIFI